MKYVVEHKQETKKLMYYNVRMTGLEVEPKNGVSGLTIKAKKVLLVDDGLQKEYIKKRINKKIDKIIKFMLRILNDDDITSDDSGMVLDEINRLKGIVINKYKAYLTNTEYKKIITKLIIVEEEFKKNYNQKMYTNYVSNFYIDNVVGRGR